MAIQESGEMYLETILVLSKERTHVHAIDIADALGYSKASVSRAVSLLKDGGYISVAPDGAIGFTEYGLSLAEKIYERHTILSQALMSLGIGEDTAKEDACRIEHVISDESMEVIKKHFQNRSL